MITFKQKGNFSKTKKFFDGCLSRDYLKVLNGYGKEGVQVLSEATPKRTGLTAASWNYEIIQSPSGEISISFFNTNIQNGNNIAIIVDTGHASKRGGWVQGRHYIDPAIQPIFDRMAEAAWKEVTRL